MRPSWPAPRMPTVEPGGMAVMADPLGRPFRDRLRLPGAPGGKPPSQHPILKREDRRGKKAGVARARLSPRERSDRNAARHLRDRKQRIEALERLALDRDAEYRQRRKRRDHARKMRGPARPRDDDLDAIRLGTFREGEHAPRRPV